MTGYSRCQADIVAGRLSGVRIKGLSYFLGIPFAEPPIGRLRFASPVTVRPWKGSRDAVIRGAAPPQVVAGVGSWIYPQPPSMSEDCLYLDIVTPSTEGTRPVLLWLFGGAFSTGSSSMPVFDGTKLAEDGDLVVVVPNYRLGILGFAGHQALQDQATGAQANWGVQDQMLALEWVHKNITAFGGDPCRITVAGQSSGAISAILLAQHQATAQLVSQLALFSVPYVAPPDVAVLEDLSVYVSDLAGHFKTTVEGLRDISASDLTYGESAFFSNYKVKTATGRFRRWPTLDNLFVESWPGSCSLGGKPILTGNTATESSFLLKLYDVLEQRLLTPPLPIRHSEMRKRLERLLAARNLDGRVVCPQSVDDVLSSFDALELSGADHERMEEAFISLNSDLSYRHPTWRIALKAACEGNSNVYMYNFDLPLTPPAWGSPHNSDLPFWFGTHDLPFYSGKLGVGQFRDQVSETMRQSLVRFVRTGRPGAGEVPLWPEIRCCEDPEIVLLGRVGTVSAVGTLGDRAMLSRLDPFYLL